MKLRKIISETLKEMTRQRYMRQVRRYRKKLSKGKWNE